MNHPAIKQTLELQSGSKIPWSAESERLLRRRIQLAWEAMWMFIGGWLLCSVLAIIDRFAWWLLPGALLFALAVRALRDVARMRETLGEEMRRGPRGEFFEGSGMLANKPRSLHSLTKFYQHPALEESFICVNLSGHPCGRKHYWAEAEWIPNLRREELVDDATYEEIASFCADPDGGRFVTLCPCGIGHFKLKPVNCARHRGPRRATMNAVPQPLGPTAAGALPMTRASKMTGTGHVASRETLPEKRQDGLKQDASPSKRKGDTDTCLRAACRKPFVLKRRNQKHCSEACRKLHYQETHFVRIAP